MRAYLAIVATAALALVGLTDAWGAICSWTGAKGTTFDDPLNWDALPADSVSADTGQFGATVTAHPVLTADRKVAGLIFQSANGGWTLDGSATLTLGASGIDDTANTAGTTTINANLLINNSTFAVGTGGHLLVNGTATTNGSRTITVTNGLVTFSSLDAIGTEDVLQKGGVGTLAVTGAAGPNYQGGFSLRAGTLILGNKGALGTGPLKFLVTSSTLQASADLSGANAVANDVTLTYAPIVSGANNISLSGSVTLTRSNAVTNSLVDGKALVLSGTVYLSDIASSGYTLTIDGTGSTTVSGVIADFSGAGTAGNLTKAGTGTLTLSNVNSYTGVTTIAGGTLNLATLADGGASSGIGASASGAGNLVLSNGTLRHTGGPASTDRLFQIGTAANGNGVAGTLDASGAGPVSFTNPGAVAYLGNAANRTRTLNLRGTNTGANTLAAAIGNNGTGAVTLNKEDAGTWLLSGANSYTGKTTVNGGTLQFAKQASLYSGSAASWTKTNIVVNSGGTLAFSVGGTNEFTTGNITTLIGNLGGDVSAGGLKGGSAIGFDTTNAAGGTFTVADNLADTTGTGGGALGVSKLGTNTLVLTGTNTYSGSTSVLAGTLLINGNLSGAPGPVTVHAGATLGGTGSIGGATAIMGAHNPGASAGIQTFGGDLTYTGGAASVHWELFSSTTANQANPNALFDQVLVGGNLNFADATELSLSFAALGSTVLWADPLWDSSLLGSGGWLLYGVTGTTVGLANLHLDAANCLDSAGNAFNTARPGSTFSLFQSGSDVYLNYTAVVIPEPATLALFALSILVFPRRRR